MTTKTGCPKWGRYCGVYGHHHSNFKQLQKCPVCYTLNPAFQNAAKAENSATPAFPAIISAEISQLSPLMIAKSYYKRRHPQSLLTSR